MISKWQSLARQRHQKYKSTGIYQSCKTCLGKYKSTKAEYIKATKLVQAKTSKVKKYKSRIYQSCKTCLSKTESLARVAASTLAFHLPSWWQNPPTSTTLQSFNFTQIQIKMKMQVQIQIQIQNQLKKNTHLNDTPILYFHTNFMNTDTIFTHIF